MAISSQLRELHPALQPAAQWTIDVAEHFGIPVHVTSVYRSNQQQAALYANYKAGRSKFPANPPGASAHNHRLAWDAVPGSGRSGDASPELKAWWTYVRQLAGFRVPPNDWIHAEYPNWQRFV